MACLKGAAAVEATAEKITSDYVWVESELDPEWVFVSPAGNEGNNDEDAGKGSPDSSGSAAAQNPQYHKEEPDVAGDGHDDQNTVQSCEHAEETIMERDADGADGLCPSNESALGFQHGACEIDVESGTEALPDDVSVHGCSKSSAFKENGVDRISHSEGAHVFSFQNFFSEGPHEDTDDEDARDAGIAHGCSEDVCKDDEEEEDKDEEEEEEKEEEEDDEDDFEYTDDLHEEALQDESNRRMNALTDAMERYYTNPVMECLQEYICSVQTETRRELHETKMASFWGYGPQPRPIIKGSKCFNPLFEAMWLPWAINAEYFHNEDMGLLLGDGTTGCVQRTLAAKRYMSSAVPILPVLEYMVNCAPGNNIAHIGSCSSLYWAALLKQLGAANVIVTEGSYHATYTPDNYPHIEQIDEENFFMSDMAVQQALFFLRPSKSSSDAEPCMAERFLFCFPGDTIFFVGECGEQSDNFNMAQWVEEHALDGWHVEKEMDIPCWPDSHDVFLCIMKGSLPVDTTI